jgi:hypothetical protein
MWEHEMTEFYFGNLSKKIVLGRPMYYNIKTDLTDIENEGVA